MGNTRYNPDGYDKASKLIKNIIAQHTCNLEL